VYYIIYSIFTFLLGGHRGGASLWGMEVLILSPSTPGLGLGVLGVAGWVPMVSEGHRMVVGCVDLALYVA